MVRNNTLDVKRHDHHVKGDHSLCIAGHCEALRKTPLDDDQLLLQPQHISERYGIELPGRRLWAKIALYGPMSPHATILLVEACRLVDRLDRINRQIHGGEFGRYECPAPGCAHDIVMVVDKAEKEARETAIALKSLVVEIRNLSNVRKTQPESAVSNGVHDLRHRIASRRENPAS